MRVRTIMHACAVLALAACSHGITTEPPTLPNTQWAPAPPVLPAGAQMAVMQGNPAAADQPFTIRLRLPDGYRLPPHTHPTDENVTVLQGTFLVGMGSTVNTSAMQSLGAGGFVSAPAGHAHYAQARGETVVQVHAIGPFAITYVNPADAPAAAQR